VTKAHVAVANRIVGKRISRGSFREHMIAGKVKELR